MQRSRGAGAGKPPSVHFIGPTMDLHRAYLMDCVRYNRDPHSLGKDVDDQCRFHAEHWALRRLLETAVGVQTYTQEAPRRHGVPLGPRLCGVPAPAGTAHRHATEPVGVCTH